MLNYEKNLFYIITLKTSQCSPLTPKKLTLSIEIKSPSAVISSSSKCLIMRFGSSSSISNSSSSGIVAQLFVVPISKEVIRLSGVPKRGAIKGRQVLDELLVKGTMTVLPLNRLGGGGLSSTRILCCFKNNSLFARIRSVSRR